LASEQEDVWDLAVASSGERFAVCSFGGVVREWRTADGQALATIAADVGSPSYSPDGRLLAIRGRRGLEVYAATTGKLLAIGKTPSTAYQTSFSRDGKTIVTFGVDSKIRLWDVPALAP
jgi:WD40 repeat protein